MKKIIVILLLFLPLFASAQRVDKPGEPYDFYCSFSVSGVSVYANFQVYVDGKYKFYHELTDENGKNIKSPFYIELLNFLSRLGWELVCFTNENNSSFLVKKRVTSDAQAKEGLYFKEEFKK